MPVKRKRGRPLNKQESQKIRTRLIQISLKVEDCIYQKIPISMMEAESFITEVTSYKPECFEDERSLQVIEKLIRCMKAIIIEHQESGTDYSDLSKKVSRVDSGTTSPVYSLSDEDRTHMTQELLEPPSVNLLYEPTTIHNDNMKYSEEMDNVADNDNKVKTINHHCDSNEEDISIVTTDTTESFANSKKSLDVDIQKALSNLSLENVDQDVTTFTDIECSQSILSNFHELDKMQQNHKSNVGSTEIRVIDNASNTVVEKNSQLQTINLLTNKPVIVNDAKRIVKAISIPSSNVHVQTGDLNKKTTNPVIIKDASRTIKGTIVPTLNVNTVELTKKATKPLSVNDARSTIKSTIVPSSNINTVDLTKTSTKPLNINDFSRTITGTIVPSLNVNMVDLRKKSTKPLSINDASITRKGTIVPSSNVNTVDLIKESKKLLMKTDASEKVKATISLSTNVKTTNKLNKQPNLRNPPLLNVPNLKNSCNPPKTYTQNVAQQFGKTIATNNISSTNNTATSNSYEQYNTASTSAQHKKNLDIKSKVQEHIVSKNSPLKKKKGPRKNNVIKKAEKLSSDETNNKIIKKKIRNPRSKKVNVDCNLNPKDSTVPIYNNFIENDLSWLENIRFVREIRDDEIDSKLTYLSENFWDNYDLPPNFDEADFL